MKKEYFVAHAIFCLKWSITDVISFLRAKHRIEEEITFSNVLL
jgi:hypothetical protein